MRSCRRRTALSRTAGARTWSRSSAIAGVGKTRLVRELWEWLAAQDSPPLRRTGRCLSYGQGITYWPLAEVLKEHFGILESDSPQIVAERLGAPTRSSASRSGLAPPDDLHPLAARERLHDSWVEFLDGLVAERPIVVLGRGRALG